MPRGIYNRKSTEQPLTTQAVFTSQAWWKKVTDAGHQKAVIAESQALTVALIKHGQSRIEVGQHLATLQSILVPYGVFNRFLKNFHFSERTANRYVTAFKNAKAGLPEPVIKAALARGMNIMGEQDNKPFGAYTEAVKLLPPPSQATEAQANAWLDSIENAKKQQRSVTSTLVAGGEVGVVIPQDAHVLLKECYRFVQLRYARVAAQERGEFVQQLVGMILTMAQVKPTKFAPVNVPEDFAVVRGRPKTAAA